MRVIILILIEERKSHGYEINYNLTDIYRCRHSTSGHSSIVSRDNSFDQQLREWMRQRDADIRQFSSNRNKKLQEKPKVPALAFDIDGVFKMGGKYADFGAEALKKVREAGLPYVLMTNGGGGRTEAQYADEMNEKLASFDSTETSTEDDVYVDGDSMVLSYTPFNTDFDHLKDKPVLIVGSPRVKAAAKHYGFTKAMHMSEYTARHPTINPFADGCEKDGCAIDDSQEIWDEDFHAILVFTDPEDFFEGVQVISDLLLSSRPGEVEYEKGHRIPIVFSNPDLLWKTQFVNGRYGQGAFRLSLEACYRARMENLGLSEEEIKERLGDFIQYGKPEIAQFDHCRRAALKQAEEMGVEISDFYMVGDNPLSDIQGAVNMQELADKKKRDETWQGILVKTGIYNDGDNPGEPDLIVDNVLNAVDHVLEKHEEDLLKRDEYVENVTNEQQDSVMGSLR